MESESSLSCVGEPIPFLICHLCNRGEVYGTDLKLFDLGGKSRMMS